MKGHGPSTRSMNTRAGQSQTSGSISPSLFNQSPGLSLPVDRSQWGAHLIPARGPVSFSEVTHNQVFVVPRQLSADLRRYIFKRKGLMQQIEPRDIQQLEKSPPPP